MKIQNRSTEAHDRSPKSKIENGFTLIEVTIAITLLALIAMTLYGAFYLGHRAVEKSQARSDESQKIRSREDLLAGYIRSAYPVRFSRQTPEIYFSGQENRLEFVSALSSGRRGGELGRSVGRQRAQGAATGGSSEPSRRKGRGIPASVPYNDECFDAMSDISKFKIQNSKLPNERGVALLLVLWIFIFLFVVAFEFTSSAREEGAAARRYAEETEGYYLALAGFQQGLYELLTQSSQPRQGVAAPGGSFAW